MEKSSGYDYAVFLSFRGPDTREDITDYLYTSMIDAGIKAYKDNEELRTGEEISGQLLQAIEQSKISIPIFSKGYADSSWCLRELVKMVESKNTRRQKIMPIFYDVAPSEVKYQTEHYGKAIDSHLNKKRFDDETIYKWKDALREVGALMGWNYQNKRYSGKGEFVKEIVYDVLAELKTSYLEVSDGLVGVDNHVDGIMSMIGSHDNETKILGICGMGGVGKTTLAKIVYNQLSNNFVGCCFLCDIRITKITSLQNQLISNILKRKYPDINNVMEGKKAIKERLNSKRVLLLLDDVDHASQLDALVQKREWFGQGSKIIITTRDRGILNVPALIDETYELKRMGFDHSLQLFSKHAFIRDNTVNQYFSNSVRAVHICGGLPLALEVIGSLLRGKSVEEWDAILKELEETPHVDVAEKLMISMKALNEKQKEIFLYVACFFVGYDKRIAIYMWESCKLDPHQNLGILEQRSLIKIRDDNQLWMHDLLRDIGRNLIQKESGMKPEKQRLVWTHAEALDVLEKTQNRGGVHEIESMEAICLEFDERSSYSLIKEFLASLPNLRFLRLDKKFLPHVDSKDFNEDSVSILTQVGSYYPRSNSLQTIFGSFILPQLRWLSWNYFPVDFELANFSLRKLVILDFSRSEITEEWDGWSHFKTAKNLKALKVLNMTECKNLRKTPDLSFLVNLERLILEGCRSLVQIDPSIKYLKSLIFLNLKYCCSLRELPDEMGDLKSLKDLLLDSTSIEEIPEWRKMNELKKLSLVECKSLHKFNFLGCVPLTRPPKSIENSILLAELDLSSSAIQELPDLIGNMKNLKVLNIMKCSVRKLPSAIGMLEKLEYLGVGSSKLRGELPNNIGKLPLLRTLHVHFCEISATPQMLPESLTYLNIASGSVKVLPDLSNLSKLRTLTFCCKKITTLPSDIVFLSQLEILHIGCFRLQCVPRLPINLSYLCIDCSWNLKTTNDLSNLRSLLRLELRRCDKLTEIRGLERLENLRSLELRGLPSLANLPRLTNLKKLEVIHVEDCPELVEMRCSLQLVDIVPKGCFKYRVDQLLISSSFKNIQIRIGQMGFDLITICPRQVPSLRPLIFLGSEKGIHLLSLSTEDMSENTVHCWVSPLYSNGPA